MDGMQPQPGQVIAPQGPTEPPQVPPMPSPGVPEPTRPPEETPQVPAPTAPPTPLQTSAAPQQPEQAQPEQPAGWRYEQQTDAAYSPDNDDDKAYAADQSLDDITWTASEFMTHEKSVGWYIAVVVGGALAAAADYLLTKDIFSSVIILFAAVAFAAISARRPRTQQYALTTQGLQIGNKPYYFQDFKNFSVTDDGAIASIVFMPLKRFMPPLTIYVAPDMEDRVIDFLSAVLPFEEHSNDAVDSLMRRIRF